ncbi:MAG: hypothetical protein AAFQ60_14440, partial [Pseudomonadota bacterium]
EANLITTSDGQEVHFEVESFKRSCLLQGLDDIGLTLEKLGHIEAYEKQMVGERPWIFDTPEAPPAN